MNSLRAGLKNSGAGFQPAKSAAEIADIWCWNAASGRQDACPTTFFKHALRSAAFVLALLAQQACAELPGGWSTNLTVALADAGSRQQPVLVYFTASWCGPCKLMARTTLTNEAVTQLLASLPHVALDVDQNSKLAEQRNVRAVPTFQMLTPAGDEVASTTGYQEPERFVEWLTNSLDEVKAAADRAKRFAEKLAEADQLLGATDAESRRKAAAELIALCAEEKGPMPETVAVRLTTLAAREPALLLDGLNHPRLAARIYVANLLRTRLGDSFDFDPWGDAAVRQKGISQWREKLAGATPDTGRNR